MPEMVKIGITDNLKERIKHLSRHTSVPLPFECFYAVKVEEDAKKIEKKIHEGFDQQRVRREREFFYTSPEQAKSILEILEIMGGTNVTPKEDIVETPQEKQALEMKKNSELQDTLDQLELQKALEKEADRGHSLAQK